MTEPNHTTLHHRHQELAFREADGLSVPLYWDAFEGDAFVRVKVDHDGNMLVLDPPKHEALSVFPQPGAFRPLDTATPTARVQPEVRT
jgi:hypothetical protein